MTNLTVGADISLDGYRFSVVKIDEKGISLQPRTPIREDEAPLIKKMFMEWVRHNGLDVVPICNIEFDFKFEQ
jgi:hypothetical protein